MMENQNISNNEEWKNNNNSAGLLSRMASGDGHGEESPYFDGWKAYEVDPFHPIDNPLGVIQMGLAENQLCFDLVKDWILKNPGASMCTPEGVDAFQETAIFQDYHGLSKFRTAVASFMEKVRGNTVKFDPDRIVLSGGATGAHEIMGFCLANPGDAFLVPTPYYPGFDRDICWRTGIKLLPIKTHSYNNFKITNSALQDAYNKAQQSHIKVKGILITNPSNPLGTILDKETLHLLITFANTYQIHLICDEIYSATVFSDKPNPFISIAQIIDQQPINPNLIHIVYSLSKDMGFPGLRVGIIYSYNDHLVKSARRMSSFNLISSQTQLLLSSMLSDTPFITHYLAETKNRLANRFNTFTSSLSQIGIPCSNSNAGLFLWMDLHNLLTDQTFEAEIHLWRTIVHQVKLNVSPGSSFHCSEPGWFRVCFANMDDHTVQVALRRIKMFVARRNHHVSKDAVVVEEKRPVGKRKCWQTNLQLRLSARRMDEVMMSPHSPMPLSPLVKATT